MDVFNLALKYDTLTQKLEGMESIIKEHHTTLLKHDDLITNNKCTGHDPALANDSAPPGTSWSNIAANNIEHNISTKNTDWRVVKFRKNNNTKVQQGAVTSVQSENVNEAATTVQSTENVTEVVRDAVTTRPMRRPITQVANRKIFGQNTVPDSKLKSGIIIEQKSVFSIDNVDGESTTETMTEFLTEHDIAPLSCFLSKTWVRGVGADLVTAFRVCVRAADSEKLMCPNLWPSGVIVRKWQFKGTNNGVRV
jgi:hypothetical protein